MITLELEDEEANVLHNMLAAYCLAVSEQRDIPYPDIVDKIFEKLAHQGVHG